MPACWLRNFSSTNCAKVSPIKPIPPVVIDLVHTGKAERHPIYQATKAELAVLVNLTKCPMFKANCQVKRLNVTNCCSDKDLKIPLKRGIDCVENVTAFVSGDDVTACFKRICASVDHANSRVSGEALLNPGFLDPSLKSLEMLRGFGLFTIAESVCHTGFSGPDGDDVMMCGDDDRKRDRSGTA